MTPLTGADDEWTALDYGPDMAAQNKRCPHVFGARDGTATTATRSSSRIRRITLEHGG